MKKIGLFALAFSLISIGSVNAATTGTTAVNVGIDGGALSVNSVAVISDFGNIVMDQPTKVVTAQLNKLNASDLTATGQGWRVVVQASQFTEVGGQGFLIPQNSLTLHKPTSVAPINGTSSPNPTISPVGNTIIDDGSQHSLLSAAVNEGMGSYETTFATPSLSLLLDASTAKTDAINYPSSPTPYNSTITWSIVSGP